MIRFTCRRPVRWYRVTLVGLAGAAFGCVDVGHSAEIGCLVDMTEPGCSPADAAQGRSGFAGIDSGRADSTSDANAGAGGAGDAPQDVAAEANDASDSDGGS